MSEQNLTKLLLAVGCVFLAPLLSAQNTEISRTEYGHPDFQGFYTFRTITPLQRPRELENLESMRVPKPKVTSRKTVLIK